MKKIFRTMLCVLCTLTLLLSLTAPAVASAEESENTVYIAVKDYGLITVVLNPEEAPITVANFKKLVGEGFYDGLTFHRIVPGFVIQGGDPKGDGTGGSDEDIKGEFTANKVNNGIKHVRGTISMARSGHPYESYYYAGYDIPYETVQPYFDSASSQFFIVTETSAGNTASLDGKYAAFGQVTDGMDVVDAISGVATDTNQKPLDAVTIAKVTFDKDEALAALDKGMTWLWITLGTVAVLGVVGAVIGVALHRKRVAEAQMRAAQQKHKNKKK